MKPIYIPTCPMPAAGQVWTQHDPESPSFFKPYSKLTVLDVTDGIVYFTNHSMVFENGFFKSPAILEVVDENIVYREGMVVYSRGYPSPMTLVTTPFHKSRIDIFQESYICISEVNTIYVDGAFMKAIKDLVHRVKTSLILR